MPPISFCPIGSHSDVFTQYIPNCLGSIYHFYTFFRQTQEISCNIFMNSIRISLQTSVSRNKINLIIHFRRVLPWLRSSVSPIFPGATTLPVLRSCFPTFRTRKCCFFSLRLLIRLVPTCPAVRYCQTSPYTTSPHPSIWRTPVPEPIGKPWTLFSTVWKPTALRNRSFGPAPLWFRI